MATAIQTSPHAARRRGRVAVHDPETLLDLVAAGTRAAVAAGEAVAAAQVSMPAFNRAKVVADCARGVDPAGPARTPTADAIQMRFKELARQPVPWAQLVDGALRTGKQRTMWLSALRREYTRDDLNDVIVIHALRFVAARREADTVARHQYEETRAQLVAADVERNGDDGILDWVLPTGNQLLAYCGFRWEKALNLAGLKPYRQPKRGGRGRRPPKSAPGMSVVEVSAFYAAVNGNWPSYPVLRHFAGRCGIRMADKPSGGMSPVREQAAALLAAEGLTPPTRTRGGGKGKRLTYRYPVGGIPGRRCATPPSGAGSLSRIRA